MRNLTKGMLAGMGLMLASSTSVLAQELTIFWAEWDPANYLQELVNVILTRLWFTHATNTKRKLMPAEMCWTLMIVLENINSIVLYIY